MRKLNISCNFSKQGIGLKKKNKEKYIASLLPFHLRPSHLKKKKKKERKKKKKKNYIIVNCIKGPENLIADPMGPTTHATLVEKVFLFLIKERRLHFVGRLVYPFPMRAEEYDETLWNLLLLWSSFNISLVKLTAKYTSILWRNKIFDLQGKYSVSSQQRS